MKLRITIEVEVPDTTEVGQAVNLQAEIQKVATVLNRADYPEDFGDNGETYTHDAMCREDFPDEWTVLDSKLKVLR